MNLIDLKVKYSNADTKTEFIPWFYENFDKEGYSVWKVDFKYNDVSVSCCLCSWSCVSCRLRSCVGCPRVLVCWLCLCDGLFVVVLVCLSAALRSWTAKRKGVLLAFWRDLRRAGNVRGFGRREGDDRVQEVEDLNGKYRRGMQTIYGSHAQMAPLEPLTRRPARTK